MLFRSDLCACMFLHAFTMLLGGVANSQTVPIQVPVRYFTNNLTQNVGIAKYYEVPICAQPAAEAKYAKLSVNLPSNVGWNRLTGVIYVEVSKSKTVWNSTTIVAVNYVTSGALISPNPLEFSWLFNTADYPQKTLYLRLRSNNHPADFALELSFVPEPVNFQGKYDPIVFGTAPPPPTMESLLQYIRLSKYASVANNAGIYIQFQFCIDAFPFNVDTQWSAVVTVISAIEYPHSAFDLYLCPASNGVKNCQPGTVPRVNLNDHAVAVVEASITRTGVTPIEKGVLALVVGNGGSGNNTFSLAARVRAPPAQLRW